MQHKKKYKVSLDNRVFGNYPAKSPEEAVQKMLAANEKYHGEQLKQAKSVHVQRGFKEWEVPLD